MGLSTWRNAHKANGSYHTAARALLSPSYGCGNCLVTHHCPTRQLKRLLKSSLILTVLAKVYPSYTVMTAVAQDMVWLLESPIIGIHRVQRGQNPSRSRILFLVHKQLKLKPDFELLG